MKKTLLKKFNSFFVTIVSVLKTDVVKVTSYSAVSTLVKMSTALISVKVIAVLIGPSGLAKLGQLQNLSSIALAVATGGIVTGVTKYVSEFKATKLKINFYISTGFKFILSLSILVSIVVFTFSHYFANYIWGNQEYRIVLIIFSFTITFYSLNYYLLALLNGFKEFKKFITINIISNITGIIFSVILVLLWNVKGALISYVMYQSVVFFITLYYSSKSEWFNLKKFFSRFSCKILGKYLHYTLMTIVSAISIPIVQLIIRTNVASRFSFAQAGLWEGMIRISSIYLMVFTTALGIYYLPRFSEITDKIELRKEIFNAWKIFLPTILFIASILFITRDLIIRLLFNSNFSPMRDLFLFQFIGDFLKIGAWILAIQMQAKAMTLAFIISELFFGVSYLTLAYFFVAVYGVIGITIAYAANYFFYLLFMLLIFRNVLFISKRSE
jgi:O-antigen/teichoic acid export membrane protein